MPLFMSGTKSLFILGAVACVYGRPQSQDTRSVADPRCPVFEHHLLPHETDCTKFYYCEYGRKYIEARSCAPGTAFSYAHQWCDFLKNVQCTISAEPQPEEAAEVAAVVSGADPSSLTNGCPAGAVHHLLPHENDCTKFYNCDHGQKHERSCNPGLHFNPRIQI
ncbi:peritrophin-1-like [Bicyclus anynana]|uniref:Peritrophin-1-like n=1 Tax=Bicyclus anynana TaxID=110368 RepID=A0ABM3M5D5_BICAN|nr:peritrophin-1-like [Bicyclus anynana]